MLLSKSDVTYRKFNSFVKEKYFSDQFKGESILFSFDSQSLSEFLSQSNLTENQFKEDLKKTFRFSLPYYIENKELLFGVCALEILIVHLMKDESEFTSKQYNPRLTDFVGSGKNNLQALYKKYQDKLWSNLKKFCDENGFYIYLPEPTTGKGRYIQYPLSQALLRQEDLNKCPYLFKELGLKKNEYISFKEFNNLLDGAFFSSCKRFLSNYFIRTREKLVKYYETSRQLNLQIFDYFNLQWDGFYPEDVVKTSFSGIQTLHKEMHAVFLSSSISEIFIRREDYSDVLTFYIDNKLFSKITKESTLFYPDILIFERDKLDGESLYVKKIEAGKDYVIISKKTLGIESHLPMLSTAQFLKNEYYDIYSFECISQKYIDSFWSKYFHVKPRNYRINGGLKIGYKCWMEGAGPLIDLPENVSIWFNGKKINGPTYDCTTLPIGTYKLKVGKFPPETIIISRETTSKLECQGGWKIDKERWEPSIEGCQVVGMLFFLKNEEIKTTTRSWINSLINKGDGANDSSLVVKSIYRNNYGI